MKARDLTTTLTRAGKLARIARHARLSRSDDPAMATIPYWMMYLHDATGKVRSNSLDCRIGVCPHRSMWQRGQC